MAKADLDLVKCALVKNEIGAEKTAKIIEDIANELKASEAEKGEKEPSVKKQFVFLLSDPQGKFKGDTDFVGWVVQIPEDDNPATALEKLQLAAYDFNRSTKGRKYPLETVAEACEFGSPKIYKEQKIWVKSKQPVLVVRTDNQLPKE